MALTTWQEYVKSQGIDPTTIPGGTNYKPLENTNYGVLGSLAGLYGAFAGGNQASTALGQSNAQLDNYINTLQDMYNPNGAVAKQMAAEAAAKDAALGRNSQYATRGIALQAALAKGMSDNASKIQALLDARSKNTLGQTQIQGQQLGSILDLASKTGVLGKANTALGNGLASMYSSLFPGTPINQPLSESVYGGGGNYGGYTTGSNENFTGLPQSIPMEESPYSNFGGNYQTYTTGSNENPVFNQPSGTDLTDEY